jgi:drug/metabolite transporter (DMT)-like permease
MQYAGELAAVGTAILWSFTAVFFAIGTRRSGAMAVNLMRLLVGVLLLGFTHLFLFGEFLPLDAGLRRWVILGLSGVIGLSLGDGFLLQAFTEIGPRKSMLIHSTSPIIGAILAWAYLSETLTPPEILGIGITISGVAWVVLERAAPDPGGKGERLLLGVLYAFCGAACQAGGIVLAKEGLAGGYSPLSATLIRMVSAAAVLWIFSALTGQIAGHVRKMKDVRTCLAVAAGAVTGPYLGVWGSLFAVAHTKVGVASTLMALAPIFIIPLVIFVFREKVSPRAWFGTLVAFGGSTLLFM